MRYVVTSLLGVLVGGLALAAEKDGTAEKFSDVSPERQDRAFDRFLDVTFVGEAWERLDPAMLTDAGLQLAEGERVLLRPHKAITSKQLFSHAIHLAGQQGDHQTLTRLARAEVVRADDALLKQLQAALKAAATDRKLTPDNGPQSISGVLLYASVQQDVREFRLTGSPKLLALLRKVIPDLPALSSAQRLQLNEDVAKDLAEDDGSPHEATHFLRDCQLAWQHEEGRRPHILRTVHVLQQISEGDKDSAAAAHRALEKIIKRCPQAASDC